MTTPESSENRETVGSGISGPTGHDLGVGTTPDTAESVAARASELPTTSGVPGPPVLFYDFNMPPRADGLFSVMPAQCTHYTGQQVIFGCQSDEIMALGVVEEISEHLLGVRYVRELPVYEREPFMEGLNANG